MRKAAHILTLAAAAIAWPAMAQENRTEERATMVETIIEHALPRPSRRRASILRCSR